MNVVLILLANSADVNMKNEKGETALMIAAQEGHRKGVNALLGFDADENLTDSKGETALAKAIKRGHTGVAVLLEDM